MFSDRKVAATGNLTRLLLFPMICIALGWAANARAEESIIRAWELNTTRPGSEYRNVSMPTDTPAACARRCAKDGRCLAWTYVKPSRRQGRARCSLKNMVPAAKKSSCCVSGVRSFEFGVDRPGSDRRSFFHTKNASYCSAECMGTAYCRAWTFVKPGVQGPKARCYLKDKVPRAKFSKCCTSGTKQYEWYGGRPGHDYKNFDLSAADPTQCQLACRNDGAKCRAWTYVEPGVQGPKARCWLKKAVPNLLGNWRHVSGVNGPNIDIY